MSTQVISHFFVVFVVRRLLLTLFYFFVSGLYLVMFALYVDAIRESVDDANLFTEVS